MSVRLGTRRPVLAAAAVLAVGALAAGCGSSSGSGTSAAPSVTPKAVVSAATGTSVYGEIHDAVAGQSSVKAVVTSQVGATSTTMTLHTLLHQKKLGVDAHIAIKSGAKTQTIDERIVDGTLYMRGSAIPTPGGKWLKIGPADFTGPLASLKPLFDQLGQASDPTGNAASLRSVKSVHVVGDVTLNGVETTQYIAQVDARKALAVLPKALRSMTQSLVGSGATTYTVSMYVAPDHLPVRTQTVVPIGGKKSTTQIDYSQWGAPLTIKAPPASQTVSLSELAQSGA